MNVTQRSVLNVREQLSRASSRKEKIAILNGARTYRPRTSGPVGPEIDYSFPLARIGGKFSFQEKMKDILDVINRWAVQRRADNCLHNHIEIIQIDENKGCEAWTELAMKLGVRYNGEHHYIFPGRRTIGKYRKADFDSAKERGLVPSGKRSREAAVRRAAARKASKRLLWPVRKAWSALPVSPPEVFVTMGSTSARSLRKSWRSSKPLVPWSQYRAKQVVEPVTVLFCQKRAVRPSELVFKAIENIYAVSLPYTSMVPMKVPGPQPRFKWRVSPPIVPSSGPIKAPVPGVSRVDGSPPVRTYLGGVSTELPRS